MESKFKKLLSLLVVYQYNLRVLHWKVVGLNFDGKHNLFGDYYAKFDEFIDSVAELALELDVNPASFSEAFAILQSLEEDVIICKGTEDYNPKEALLITGKMFEHLLRVVESCQEGLPTDVQGSLDDIKQYLRLEGRYKNKRRIAFL